LKGNLMEFDEYQQAASVTDQRPGNEGDAIVIPLLGIAGEIGALLTEYKKLLRDGPGHARFEEQVKEELGDVLWYVSNLASKLGLSLGDVASANLLKVNDRWLGVQGQPILFDDNDPLSEQIPRVFEVEFRHDQVKGKTKLVVTRGGEQVGDRLTDNAYEVDGYRFHDAYHFTFAALLGWSPVTRSNLHCKRRGNPTIDEVEDGGRAWVIEEGIAALVFAYASDHGSLTATGRVDTSLLKTIRTLVAGLEVRIRSSSDWEQAIVTGSRAWKDLNDHGGGTLRCDLLQRSVDYAAPIQGEPT